MLQSIARQYPMSPSYNWDYDWVTLPQSKKISVNSSKFRYYTSDQRGGFSKVKLYVHKKDQIQQLNMFYEVRDVDNFNTDHFYPEEEKAMVFEMTQDGEKEQKHVQMSTELISQSSWVTKYSARRYIDLLSDESHNRLVLTWAKNWDRIVFKEKVSETENKRNINMRVEEETDPYKKELDMSRLILLSGPPGCGKTTLARVVARHCGYKFIEINASDTRSAKELIRKIDDMANIQSISDKPTFIIIDEVDGILDNETNGIGQILNYIHTGEIPGERSKKDKKNQKQKQSLYTKRPIIFICNDPFVKGLKQLRRKCYTVYMQKIKTESIMEKLKSICEQENVNVEREALTKIADLNSNDIRGSMAMLEFLVNHKDFGRTSATKIINSIDWDIKDSSKSPVDFIEKLMLRCYAKKDNDLQGISAKLYDIESGPSLVLQTLFYNLKNSRPAQRHTTKVPELLQVLAQSDISINTSFGNEGTMGYIYALPYYYFKHHFKAQDNTTRVQFPVSYFQTISKKKQYSRRLQQLWEGFHNSLKIYYSPHILRYTLKPLLGSIQTIRTNEKELVRCLRLMVTYGIKFDESENQLYSPPLETMVSMGKFPPKRILSNVGKNLMKGNYANIKESIDNIKHDIKPTQWKISLNSAKGKGEGIQYKSKEGTGTEVKDIIKMSYFL